MREQVKINELLDTHLISSLSEQAKLVGSVNASLMKSAQWALGTQKNSLALVGPLEDAARMTAWGEQAKFAAMASTVLAESAQRALGIHKSSLAHVGTLIDAVKITALGEQAKFVGFASTMLAESAQRAIGVDKNSLIHVGVLAESMKMTMLGEQAKLMGSVSTMLAKSAQQVIGIDKNSLAHVGALVDSMRMTTFSGVSAQQQVQGLLAGLSEQVRAITALPPAVTGLQQNVQAMAQMLSSPFPTYLFEGLKCGRETWLGTASVIEDFVRKQGVVEPYLAQLLREQVTYYQTWLDGEHDAFTEEFVSYASGLFIHAWSMLHNVEDANDAVQDTYEKALRALKTYSVGRIRRLNVSAWLHRILTRTVLNFLRDRRRCEPYEANWMERQPGSHFDQPEAVLVRQELLQIVYDSFRDLPEIQHKIIFMHYLGAGSSLNEIADYLERPLGTVKVYLSRGLHALRRSLIERGLSVVDFVGLVETLSTWPYSVDCSSQRGEMWEE